MVGVFLLPLMNGMQDNIANTLLLLQQHFETCPSGFSLFMHSIVQNNNFEIKESYPREQQGITDNLKPLKLKPNTLAVFLRVTR